MRKFIFQNLGNTKSTIKQVLSFLPFGDDLFCFFSLLDLQGACEERLLLGLDPSYLCMNNPYALIICKKRIPKNKY